MDTMLRPIFTLIIFTVAIAAQTPERRITEGQIQNNDKERDIKVLHGIPRIKIGAVGSTKSFSEAEARKVVFDTLVRYNVPVEWTPTAYGYALDAPSLWLLTNISRGGCTNGCVVVNSLFRFVLFETVILSRADPVKVPLPIWSVEEDGDFDPETSKDEMIRVLKRLTEKFSLSYLAANR